jgi:parvulin-like peptidyl-prolyl isomerase
MGMRNCKRLIAAMLLIALPVLAQATDNQSTQKNTAHKPIPSASAKAKAKALDYIAIVGDERISMTQYIGALRKGMRKRFYHGKIPKEKLKKFRKEVAEKLVDRQLSIQEAKRRGIKPDMVEVRKKAEQFDQKFKKDPQWQKARAEVLKQLEERLQGDSLAKQLEQQVRSIPSPTKDQLRDYYNQHKDLFTTPQKVRVSLILLKVDPSSPSAVWQQAREEANDILDRIKKGSDFADLARIHSSDKSAQNGGDMGYIHAGMLGENAQKVLDIMEPGEVSAPVILLEGVALFRLDDRQKPELNPLKSVRERAAKLYMRDQSDKAWKDLIAKLHANTKIEYNDAPWR